MKADVSLENYQEHIRQLGPENLLPMLQEGYRFCQEAAAYYYQDVTVREAIDLFLDRLSEHLEDSSKPIRTKESSVEVRLIRRFLAMHGRVKNQRQLKSYIQSLQQAIRSKLVRKDSALAEDIALIQQKLIAQHNRLDENGSITITINDAWRKKLRQATEKNRTELARKKWTKS